MSRPSEASASTCSGTRTQADATPPVLDWRMSPLAEAFFRAGPGEPYELEAGQSGKVLERWVGRRRRPDRRYGQSAATMAASEPATARTEAPVHIAATGSVARSIMLDPEQQRAVDLPADTSLVVDGEAGVGKTLVALYRIASLAAARRGEEQAVPRARPRADRGSAPAVPPARRSARHREARDRRRRRRGSSRARTQAFPGLPKRLSEGATAQVIALKRHPAVRAVLDDFIGWKPPKDDDEDSRARAPACSTCSAIAIACCASSRPRAARCPSARSQRRRSTRASSSRRRPRSR